MADLLVAAAHFSPTPWEPAEPGFAGAKHRGIELRLACGRRSAGKYPVELRAIECDQQQVHARIDRLDHGGADIVLIDRTHHQIIGDDDALMVPPLADNAVDHLL